MIHLGERWAKEVENRGNNKDHENLGGLEYILD